MSQESHEPPQIKEMASISKKHPPYKKITFVALIVFLILGGAYLLSQPQIQSSISQVVNQRILSRGGQSSAPNRVEIPESTITDRESAWVSMRANSLAVRVGEQINIDVIANSNGEDISGYDLLVAFDPMAFQLQTISSADPAFDVYTYDRIDYTSITAIKDPQVQTATVFDSTKVITLTLVPQLKGEHKITILPEKELETSKFVNNQTEVITPQIETLTVAVQE